MWPFMGCIMVGWATSREPGVLPASKVIDWLHEFGTGDEMICACDAGGVLQGKESGAWTSLPYAVDPDAPVRSLETKER